MAGGRMLGGWMASGRMLGGWMAALVEGWWVEGSWMLQPQLNKNPPIRVMFCCAYKIDFIYALNVVFMSLLRFQIITN